MKKRELSAAFNRWDEMVVEAKEMRVKLTRFVNRMLKKELTMCFLGWMELWEEMVRKRDLGDLESAADELAAIKLKLHQTQMRVIMKRMMHAACRTILTPMRISTTKNERCMVMYNMR